jgi:hypothetical protein
MMKLNRIHFLIVQGKIKQQQTKGFILADVLVGILLTLIFTSIAMQVVVMAAAVKIRGDEVSEATIWIQQDLEDVKSKASDIDYIAATSTAPATYSYSASRCTATSTTSGYAEVLRNRTSLYGGAIGSTADNNKTSILGARPYKLVRTAIARDKAPYNVLEVTYGVYKATDTTYTSPIATFYAEVIPGASFTCK